MWEEGDVEGKECENFKKIIKIKNHLNRDF